MHWLLLTAAAVASDAADWHHASIALRTDASNPDRWVALAQSTDDPHQAEPLYEEALRLDPDHVAAAVGLAQTWSRTGRTDEAIARLEAVGEPGLIALAEARRDAGPARRALQRHPGDPEAALAVARWTDDRDEARAAIASVEVPDRRVDTWRVADALRTGDRTGAAAALRALPPHGRDTERLERWLSCLQADTVQPDTIAALWALRSNAIATPGAEVPIDRTTRCAAVFVLGAASGSADPIADLKSAAALAPEDSGIARRLGDVLLADGRAAEAVPWLQAAHDARPFEAPTSLAQALAAIGERDRARRLLDAVASEFPEDPGLAGARADLATDPRTELALLLDGVERTRDPLLLDRARALANTLRDEDALQTVLRGPRLAPLPDDVAEEIVVIAEDSQARLDRIIETLSTLGYGPARYRPDGSVHFVTQGMNQPAVTLHPDGRLDVEAGGRVPVKQYPWMEDSPIVWKLVSDRKRKFPRGRVITALQPTLREWRDALCREGHEDRLLHEIPAELDRVWIEGIDRDGSALATPTERRVALLTWWATRTCTPEGDAVRNVIVRYIDREVQTSDWPVTPAEVDQTQRRASCETPLVLAME